MRVPALSAALLALVAGGTVACGLLDGIAGGGAVNEGAVCDAFRDLGDFEAGCRGTALPPDNNLCSCLFQQRDLCPSEWRDLEECLL